MQIATCRFDFFVLNHFFVLSPPPCKLANTRSALSMFESKFERREKEKRCSTRFQELRNIITLVFSTL